MYRTVYTFSIVRVDVCGGLPILLPLSNPPGSSVCEQTDRLHCTECVNMHPIKVDTVWRLYGSRESLSLNITVNRSSVTRISHTHAQMHKCAIQYTSYNTVHMLQGGCGLVGLLSRSPLPFLSSSHSLLTPTLSPSLPPSLSSSLPSLSLLFTALVVQVLHPCRLRGLCSLSMNRQTGSAEFII